MSRSHRMIRRRLVLLIGLLILLLDQVSKYWARSHSSPGQVQPFVPGVLLELKKLRSRSAPGTLRRIHLPDFPTTV